MALNLSCHAAKNIEEIVDELKGMAASDFSQWSMVTFDEIIYSIKGLNGDEARHRATALAERFHGWYVGRTRGLWEWFYPKGWTPRVGGPPFPSSVVLRQRIDEAQVWWQNYADVEIDSKWRMVTGSTRAKCAVIEAVSDRGTVELF